MPTDSDKDLVFAVISDIHGNVSALDAVLADIAHRGVGDIVNLGDSLSGPLDPAATVERLMARGLPTVRGNHDRALLVDPAETLGLWETWTYPELGQSHFGWLRSLPETLVWQDAVYLCHGSPRGDTDNWLHDRDGKGGMRERGLGEITDRAQGVGQSLMLCGHTHLPRVVRLADGRLCINPGAVGLPAYSDTRPPVPTAAMAGAPDARYAICERRDGGWRISQITVPYDPTQMAKMARDKGADDWAEHLKSGWSAI